MQVYLPASCPALRQSRCFNRTVSTPPPPATLRLPQIPPILWSSGLRYLPKIISTVQCWIRVILNHQFWYSKLYAHLLNFIHTYVFIEWQCTYSSSHISPGTWLVVSMYLFYMWFKIVCEQYWTGNWVSLGKAIPKQESDRCVYNIWCIKMATDISSIPEAWDQNRWKIMSAPTILCSPSKFLCD
jgi:hypothetical protein